MRQLRNIVVRFADTSTRYRERKMLPEKSQTDKSAIFMTPASLYLLFCKDYNMLTEGGDYLTNYQELQEESKKRELLENFFDWEKIERILSEKKLTTMFGFFYNDCQDVLFLGKKKIAVVNQSSTSKHTADAAPDIPDERKKELESEIKALNSMIKTEKKEAAVLKKSINIEELQRMDLGRRFRRTEKENSLWDAEGSGS